MANENQAKIWSISEEVLCRGKMNRKPRLLMGLWILDSGLLISAFLPFRKGIDIAYHNTYLVIAATHLILPAWLAFTLVLVFLTLWWRKSN